MNHPFRDFAENVRLGLPNVRRKTAINDHLGARIDVAAMLKHDRAEKVFRALRTIHEVECEMTDEMLAIERKWTQLMLRWVEIHHPNLTADIRQSL